MVALRAANGDRKVAGIALGISSQQLADRINGDPQLKQMFGWKDPNKPEVAPTVAEAAARTPENLPDGVKQHLELVQLVSKEDSERLITGLKEFDFSEKSLDKIRKLGNLAESTGMFIAVALEKTHQNYVVQQFGLMELAADMKRRLMIEIGNEGYIDDPEIRSMFTKNYVEMVKESGNGVKLSVEFAEIITRMLEAAKNKKVGTKRKPGFTKVTAIEAQTVNGKA